jgi:hypothetical protein
MPIIYFEWLSMSVHQHLEFGSGYSLQTDYALQEMLFKWLVKSEKHNFCYWGDKWLAQVHEKHLHATKFMCIWNFFLCWKWVVRFGSNKMVPPCTHFINWWIVWKPTWFSYSSTLKTASSHFYTIFLQKLYPNIGANSDFVSGRKLLYICQYSEIGVRHSWCNSLVYASVTTVYK